MLLLYFFLVYVNVKRNKTYMTKLYPFSQLAMSFTQWSPYSISMDVLKENIVNKHIYIKISRKINNSEKKDKFKCVPHRPQPSECFTMFHPWNGGLICQVLIHLL